jgi:hypothetical protein
MAGSLFCVFYRVPNPIKAPTPFCAFLLAQGGIAQSPFRAIGFSIRQVPLVLAVATAGIASFEPARIPRAPAQQTKSK